ncbi:MULTISPECIES: hypothetical protein [unclassified Microbacterium]|uniref:hypothetical protein n=1 Tax=unclassified Microbacterium TaxID=2609290 RepID=UPI003016696C
MTAIVLALGVVLIFIVITINDAQRMRRHRAALAELHRQRRVRRGYYCDCTTAEVCTLCTPGQDER